ncbi:MAG: hypothetical protein MUC41_05910 [Syntrophobacteraceae bacterium]|nr:hypothetical protein [Syntrophobacteraceae bacterium]
MSRMPRRNKKSETGRRSIRWWPVMAAVVVVLVSALAFAFQAAAFQRYLVESWVEYMEQRGGFRLQMSEYAWNWPFRLVVGKAEVIRHGKTILNCDRAVVTFSPSLKKPFLRVTALSLDRPVLYLEKDSSGQWIAPSEPDSVSGGKDRPRDGEARKASSLFITVQVQSGAIVAQQDGRQVLRVGNVAGQLTLPHDVAMGMGSLLASLEKLRPAAPRALSLRHMDAGSREGAAP